MTVYPVTVSRDAADDLMVVAPPVRECVWAVIFTELRIVPRTEDADEGYAPAGSPHAGSGIDSGLRWRRAITPQARAALDAGLDLPPAVEEACEFVIVFQVDSTQKRRVMRVLSNADLAPAVIRHLSGARQPHR